MMTCGKNERMLIYIIESLKSNRFCSSWDDFKKGIISFLFSPSGRRVKKVIGAFKTTNDPKFKDFYGDEITLPIFNKVAEFMRNHFPHDELFAMKFEELRGPDSKN